MNTGYLYKTTYKPTGLMYFGSRKLKEGMCPETDEYKGTPCGSNKMLELFETKPECEFVKEVLTAGEYDDMIEFEPLLIEEAWDKFGKESEGGKVCNLNSGGAIYWTEEMRSAKSAKMIGKPGPNKGKPVRDEVKSRISETMKRRGIPTPEPKRMAVINTETGEEWPSVAEASRCLGIAKSTLWKRIDRGFFGGVWQYKEAA